MSVEVGDTFLFDPDGRNQKHLWVVLATYVPDFQYEEFAIIVHLTTVTPRTTADQKVCVLEAYDEDRHRFVRTSTYVHYGDVRQVECSKLVAQNGHEQATESLVSRMRKGLHASKYTKRGFKKIVPRE